MFLITVLLNEETKMSKKNPQLVRLYNLIVNIKTEKSLKVEMFMYY